jgi:hypothetical protein
VDATILSVTGWSIVLAAFVLWEASAVLFRYPRLGDVFGYVTRWRIGRYLLFGMWLWVGWHFFIRGWHFFLRSRV